MRYLSVCSGIEAATCAWHPLGWTPVGFSEIEKFPSAVLAHHYPGVPNFGDLTKFKDWPDDLSPDVLVGGTPCQSFSVAGLRKGLADPRGNLALTYLALADRYRPEWLVWENVPGIFSSESHDAPDPSEPPPPLEVECDGQEVETCDEYESEEIHAFQCFLAGLSELGYGFAYRVLDAQYFGVAQRRRRVFVVANSRDWRRAAAVLFERESLSRHPAPRRETGKDVAPTISARTSGGGGLGTDFDLDGGLIPQLARCVTTGEGMRNDYETCTIIPDIARTLLGKHNASHDDTLETYVTHTLRADGFDASEDGTGRGTPLVPIAFDSRQDCVFSTERFGALGSSSPQAQAVVFDTTQITSPANHSNPKLGDACHTLAAGAHPPALANSMAVRRLTPRECERLQGLPDDYTDIRPKGKDTPDGPRYKAIGNSMAEPCMAWIGRRIAMVVGASA